MHIWGRLEVDLPSVWFIIEADIKLFFLLSAGLFGVLLADNIKTLKKINKYIGSEAEFFLCVYSRSQTSVSDPPHYLQHNIKTQMTTKINLAWWETHTADGAEGQRRLSVNSQASQRCPWHLNIFFQDWCTALTGVLYNGMTAGWDVLFSDAGQLP